MTLELNSVSIVSFHQSTEDFSPDFISTFTQISVLLKIHFHAPAQIRTARSGYRRTTHGAFMCPNILRARHSSGYFTLNIGSERSPKPPTPFITIIILFVIPVQTVSYGQLCGRKKEKGAFCVGASCSSRNPLPNHLA